MGKAPIPEQSLFDAGGTHQTGDTGHHIPIALTVAGDDGGYTASSTDSDSYSTNWTCDDIPGTGRIIDKYVYQFLGRKLEMFMTKLPVLHQQEIIHEAMVSAPDGEKEDQQLEEDHLIYDDTAYSQSIYSDSSMATINDNPGAGRTLDTHFFQPLGKLTERVISRVLLRTLPLAFPAERIISRVINIHDDLNNVGGVTTYPLKLFIDYTEEVGIEWILPGLYALVKQCS